MEAALQFMATTALDIQAISMPPGTPPVVVCLPPPTITMDRQEEGTATISVTDAQGTMIYEELIHGTVSFSVEMQKNSHYCTSVCPHIVKTRGDKLLHHAQEILTNDIVLESCMPVLWGNHISVVAMRNTSTTTLNEAVFKATSIICCCGHAELRVRSAPTVEWKMPEWSAEELEGGVEVGGKAKKSAKTQKRNKHSVEQRQARVCQRWVRLLRGVRHRTAQKFQVVSCRTEHSLVDRFLQMRCVQAETSAMYKRCVLYCTVLCVKLKLGLCTRSGLALVSETAVSPPLCY